MTLLVTYIRPRPMAVAIAATPLAVPVPAAPDLAAHETICQSCRFLLDGICFSPNCGCPRDTRRVRPWASFPRCPEGKW